MIDCSDVNIHINPGKYVVAVSGGVDSVVLLHTLHAASATIPELELVVAHFDHGIRPDSTKDAEFVAGLAADYGLEAEVGSGSLGPDSSEELARDTRYHFLRIAQKKHQAVGIITGHHQDDLLETAIINMIRGTGRSGLSSLRSHSDMVRPMLHLSKTDVIDYAKKNNLQWREDSTNADTSYLRNQVRLEIMPRFTAESRNQLLQICQSAASCNEKIDLGLQQLLQNKSYRRQGSVYSRYWFNRLPHSFGCEVVHFWLRTAGVHDYSRQVIDKIVVQLKTLRPGKQISVGSTQHILLSKRSIRLHL